MVVKDKVVGWFIRNIIMSKMEIMDKPGFIITKFTEKNQTVYLRDIFLPEMFYVNLENDIIKKYGNKGRQALYSIGKKFGYRYAMISKYPTLDKVDEKEFKNFLYNLVMYVGVVYTSSVSHEFDIKNKTFILKSKNHVIYRKNGFSYLVGDGGTAGVIAYILSDPSVEGVATKCQKKGDGECELICAPEKILIKRKIKFFKERDFKNLNLDDKYSIYNEIKQTKYVNESFESLLNTNFLSYSKGVINFRNERFIPSEISMIYLIEDKIKQIKAEKILFDVAFACGKKIAETEKVSDFQKFISNFMSAFGWGDFLVVKEKNKIEILVNYLPWTKFSKNSKMIILRGLLSGMLTVFLNRKVILDNLKLDTSGGSFNGSFSEK